ncbi:acyltransferase family protein [Mangrovitalea sediminis]|uniref:acyltransferase family protein n=1 Tax=Mangrovitalea sediminis TaxID=1982043 RepID=UPI001304477B|nr:acyltransferase family protein [Mangrovitalea sediminis]
MDIEYRKDIDGLRALAIIPVIFFHMHLSAFSGGFIGVDVFFAISGFLITSIIIKKMNTSTFSFKDFYARRFRRLAPAALIIYLTTLLTFFFIYPPPYYQSVSKAALSSLTFVSNIYFWKQGGYFSSDLSLNPFLHTWSLSIEEQYYLAFPLFMLITLTLFREKLAQLLIFIIVSLFSIYLAIHYTPSYRSFAAFYLLPPRFYELCIGGIAAIYIHYYPQSRYRSLPYLKEVGMALIAIPIFAFNSNTKFPSYNALFPVIGASLIMFSSNERSVVNLLLKSKLLTFIGIISYSLYLWHWPIIVFSNWIYSTNAWPKTLLILSATFIFSWLSYKYIETPFRKKEIISNTQFKKIFIPAFAAVALLSTGGIIYGNAFYSDPTGAVVAKYEKAIHPEIRRDCTDRTRNTGKLHICSLKIPYGSNPSKKIFVWGDSHGSAAMTGFSELASKYKIDFANTTGCPPIIDIRRNDWRQSCVRVNNMVFHYILKNHYDLIILFGAFDNYLDWGVIESNKSNFYRNPSKSEIDFSAAANSTFEKLTTNNTKFLIMAQPPRFNRRVPDQYIHNAMLGIPYDGETISRKEYDKQLSPFYEAIGKRWGAHILSLENYFCDKETCVSIKKGQILFKDNHHISNFMALQMVNLITPAVEKVISIQRK